jgi:membrane fusion protein (multidrug efflux system)
LARLDINELLARKEKALENKKKAKRDMDRMEKLFKENIVPESSYQDAKSLFVSTAAELRIVEEGLNDSSIRAPFTGRIVKKLTEVGEIVGAGTPLAILAEIDPVVVKAAVPDNFIRKIRTGQMVSVRADSYPQQIFEGVIHRLETTADPLSRTFGMEVRLANPGEKLRPGLIAQVEVVLRKKESGITIPLDTIMSFGSHPTVFVVKNLIAEKRMIRTGDIVGEDIEVLEGLVPSEMVVISGQEYLKNGQSVVIEKGPKEKE